MSYSCSDFTDAILDALGIVVPDESADSPSDQADLALAVIQALQSKAKTLDAIQAGAPVPARVWVVTVNHRHGSGALGAYRSEEEANERLFGWVKEWWEREVGGEMPTDRAEAIAAYFEAVEDEDATIDECHLAV